MLVQDIICPIDINEDFIQILQTFCISSNILSTISVNNLMRENCFIKTLTTDQKKQLFK